MFFSSKRCHQIEINKYLLAVVRFHLFSLSHSPIENLDFDKAGEIMLNAGFLLAEWQQLIKEISPMPTGEHLKGTEKKEKKKRRQKGLGRGCGFYSCWQTIRNKLQRLVHNS